MKNLILIMGSPSAGKTHTSNELQTLLNASIIRQDTYMEKLGWEKADSEEVFKLMLNELNNQIDQNKNIIIEGILTPIRKDNYLSDKFIQLAKENDYKTSTVFLRTTLKTVKERANKKADPIKAAKYFSMLTKWYNDAIKHISNADLIIDSDNKTPLECAKIIANNQL